jgi:hypothetical protein
MAPKPKPLVLSFIVERETKRTMRFQEVADNGEDAIGTLYVQKDALAELGNPEILKVTVGV